ncbi:MAG TPA: adenylate cyclase regulatory domain-containing protein [Solirubrobacteraceae bacterium]|nr:adenylate cyclase regulatory domain-containing protein [Solirubrobacteraceae bacterium]
MGRAIDWEHEGLLDGLDADALAGRAELLDHRHAQGSSIEDLRAATADGRLLFLGAERAVAGEARYSMREVCERTGISMELLAALRRAHGVPVPDPDAKVFGDIDVEAAELTTVFAARGLSDEQMIDITRVLARGLAQAGEAMRSLVLELVLEPGASELELAQRYATAVESFMPLVGPMMEQMTRLHLRHAVRTEVISAAEREAGSLPGARDVTIAFADLVGFTRLGEELPPEELGRVADRLEHLTNDTLVAPVRLVKTIGDAVMLVSPEPEPVVAMALDLLDASDAEGDGFPQLRVGLAAGRALSRAGDWYGRPVNVASRVTQIARAGSVLATREVRDAAPERYRWSSAGARSIKGLPDPVRLYRARRLGPPDA